MAAGMALSGRIVFTYSIANFPTLRCLEHIRNDVCYHQANVKVVSVGGGFAYGSMGATHFATEDLGVMRMLSGNDDRRARGPGRDTACDACDSRAAGALLSTARQGWRARSSTPRSDSVRDRQGDPAARRSDATIISTGGMLHNAVAAAERWLGSRDSRSRLEHAYIQASR